MSLASDDQAGAMSEEEYWDQIRAYNADGTYSYPPPPINADQTFDFWMHVAVPDEILQTVRRRDEERHVAAEKAIDALHHNTFWVDAKTLVTRRPRSEMRAPLSPEIWQKRLDAEATRRRYRQHPELLEQTETMAMLRMAIEKTNALRDSVPPRRIPPEQIRMAARLGALAYNADGLQPSELEALRNFDLVFMGQRQSVADVWRIWRPDKIAWY